MTLRRRNDVDPVTIVINRWERDLILRYGYPFEDIERQLRDGHIEHLDLAHPLQSAAGTQAGGRLLGVLFEGVRLGIGRSRLYTMRTLWLAGGRRLPLSPSGGDLISPFLELPSPAPPQLPDFH